LSYGPLPPQKIFVERFIVAIEKGASPSWIDVKAALRAFNRAGLQAWFHDIASTRAASTTGDFTTGRILSSHHS
jgi:hypothetical protein